MTIVWPLHIETLSNIRCHVRFLCEIWCLIWKKGCNCLALVHQGHRLLTSCWSRDCFKTLLENAIVWMFSSHTLVDSSCTIVCWTDSMFCSDFEADSIFCRESLDDSVIGGICEGVSIPYLPYFAIDSIFLKSVRHEIQSLRKFYDIWIQFISELRRAIQYERKSIITGPTVCGIFDRCNLPRDQFGVQSITSITEHSIVHHLRLRNVPALVCVLVLLPNIECL